MTPLTRIAYRSRQFWNALAGRKTQVPEEVIRPHLSATQVALFQRMQASEQAHAFRAFERLKAAGQGDPDLLAATLLHDVGKIRSPLTPFDRVLIVLGRYFFPGAVGHWGTGEARGLRRPFVVAAQHPAWGAELAAAAGASAQTCELIHRHQESTSADNPLLAALQAVDDES
jgi:hypothetical protein